MQRYLSFKKKFLVLFKEWFQWNDNCHLTELFYKRISSFEKGVVKLSKDLLFGRKFAIWKIIFKYYVFLERNVVMSPCLEKRAVILRKNIC